jgi:8-oxo-dGTP diphosphatase/2-hydroxy-dATP diphosphatase
MKRKLLTLTVIHDGEKILLGKKKRGYATGVWNGYGGKVEEGESVETAMIRELYEESGLTATEHEKVAHITFTSDIEDYISDCHIYKIHSYDGDLIETEEMLPKWFDFSEIPYQEMWPDDIHWLPKVLEGKKVRGHFSLNGHNQIESFKLEEVEVF